MILKYLGDNVIPLINLVSGMIKQRAIKSKLILRNDILSEYFGTDIELDIVYYYISKNMIYINKSDGVYVIISPNAKYKNIRLYDIAKISEEGIPGKLQAYPLIKNVFNDIIKNGIAK